MVSRSFFLLLAIVTLVPLSGCRRDIGECNLDNPDFGARALAVATRVDDGLPMYEGQALVHSTCGRGQFCHAPQATGADRYGVPKGLDFDVRPACVGATCDEADLERLEKNASRTFGLRSSVAGQVRSKAMPPGGIGKELVEDREWVREDLTPLPSIFSAKGREIVRNWIACGTPVVARAQEVPACGAMPAEPCSDSSPDEICICVGTAMLPDPNWQSIYDTVVVPQCLSCHMPGGVDSSAVAVLDLETGGASGAHSRMVGVAASTNSASMCEGFGTLIVAGDADLSIFVQKIRNDVAKCGDVMPPATSGVLPSVVQVIEDWINAGAAPPP